jgi:uncharacterized membrane protein
MMRWNQRYLLGNYLKSSLWVIPFFAIPLALIAAKALHRLDVWLQWSLLEFDIDASKTLLEAFVSATLAFVVFTFGSLLVAIQVASAQMTPRIIATTLLRNDVVKYTVGLLIFTLMFALSAQNRLDEESHQLIVFVAILFGLLSFAAFFYLIDYASRLLRPVSILTRVGDSGLAVLETVYPNPSLGQVKESRPFKLAAPDRTVRHRGTSGIVMAVRVRTLLAKAEASDGVIEFVPQVGDFVAVDDPLFNLFGGARSIEEEELHGSIAFGSERTMDQDPTFAFRIAVDIALKALSPAINDPTTAVLAIDQLQRMLRVAGKRDLRTDEILDKSGKLRVIVRTPNWDDFVHLAIREIRICGSNNLQIVRRLRAMLGNLLQTLPEYRHPALLQELSLLDREITKHFIYPEDVALARIGDTQGLGVHSPKGSLPERLGQ